MQHDPDLLRRRLALRVLALSCGASLGVASSMSCHGPVTSLETTCADPADAVCGATTVCPQGTYCAPSDAGPARCALDRATGGGSALTAGFAVSEFLLAPTPDSMSSYELRIPRGAEIINCALFVCSPSVSHGGAGAAISNFGECVHANRVLDVRDFAAEERIARLDLATLEPLQSQRPCDLTRDAEAALRIPLVSTLLLGCLAFDNRRVIRATRLLELTPANLPQAAELPVSDCGSSPDTEGRLCLRQGSAVCDTARTPPGVDCTVRGNVGSCTAGKCVSDEATTALADELLSNPPLVVEGCAASPFTDGQNCYPSLLGGYGTCGGERCRPRCIDEADCGAPAHDDTRDVLRCFRERSSTLGLCLPEALDAR